MVDTQTVKQSPILKRSTELYLSLCQHAATIQTELNYNEMPELRNTFKAFRYCLYEIYFLLVDSYEFDSKLRSEIEEWSKINRVSNKKEKEFYTNSLDLFKFLKSELNRLSIISIREDY